MGAYILVEWYQWNLGILLIGNFVDGCLGQRQCLMGASFLYVSDNVSIKHRLVRFVVLQSLINIGVAVGNLVTGYMIASLSWLYCFMIVTVTLLVAFFWILLLLPENKESLLDNRSEPKESCSWLKDAIRAFKVCFFYLYFTRNKFRSEVLDYIYYFLPFSIK